MREPDCYARRIPVSLPSGRRELLSVPLAERNLASFDVGQQRASKACPMLGRLFVP